jgi:ABC-type amino acid transport substrate-binding protein
MSPAEVIVPVFFNFPSAGKLLGLSFILFACWFSGSSLTPTQLPLLLSVGTFIFFGPSVTAIPFLLDMFQLPSDLFQIFLSVDVLTGRFSVLLSAMFVLSVAVLTGVAVDGRLTIDWKRLLRWALVSVAGSILLVVGCRLYFSHMIDPESKTYEMFIEMDLHTEPGDVLEKAPPPPFVERGGVLESIRETGLLRVCYSSDSLPFAFVNARNRLVGYDVDIMHTLARELGARLHFHKTLRSEYLKELDEGSCHIMIGGLALTPDRVRTMTMTAPYLDNTLAFVVRDHERHDWATWDQVRRMESPRIAIPDSEHYVKTMSARLPNAEILPVDNVRPFFRQTPEEMPDALLFGAEAAGAWTLVYPSFAVVVPKPNPISIPLAYGARLGEDEWARYIDVFIELKRHSGAMNELYDHWILGQATQTLKEPRWSIARDVLGWID